MNFYTCAFMVFKKINTRLHNNIFLKLVQSYVCKIDFGSDPNLAQNRESLLPAVLGQGLNKCHPAEDISDMEKSMCRRTLSVIITHH